MAITYAALAEKYEISEDRAKEIARELKKHGITPSEESIVGVLAVQKDKTNSANTYIAATKLYAQHQSESANNATPNEQNKRKHRGVKSAGNALTDTLINPAADALADNITAQIFEKALKKVQDGTGAGRLTQKAIKNASKTGNFLAGAITASGEKSIEAIYEELEEDDDEDLPALGGANFLGLPAAAESEPALQIGEPGESLASLSSSTSNENGSGRK